MTPFKRLAVPVILAALSTTVVAQSGGQSPAEFRRMLDTGLKHRTASELYDALRADAHGGKQSPPYDQLPDWSGLWTIAGGNSFFDPGPGGIMPKLKPPAAAALREGAELAAKGIEYDENLSQCGPPGFPRWLVIPFLREFIVRPEQTWLTSETVNNVRRIYTDGRSHPAPDERYPLYYGDSIGFWDGPKLVIHTNQLMTRSMGRGQPNQSDQMETVEIWQKVRAGVIEADVWIYDPALYAEPWYLKRAYRQIPNPDKSVRIQYWNCNENPNNDVFKTPDGSTNYKDFTFTNQDDSKEPTR
ncbi:MAG TPA: hypothetical protein VGR73_09700 [Bryobacteraceae bacterium]|nr:hypothetical protein [Bryobacteraceae bacterium]